jgi:hypothetical protein
MHLSVVAAYRSSSSKTLIVYGSDSLNQFCNCVFGKNATQTHYNMVKTLSKYLYMRVSVIYFTNSGNGN